MTRLEEIKKTYHPESNVSQAVRDDIIKASQSILYLIQLVEKQREALQDIAEHSQAPFTQAETDNWKWLNYVHDVAQDALK